MLKKLSYLVFILVLSFNLSVYSSDASKSSDDDFDVALKSLSAQQSTSDSTTAAASVPASSFQVALSPATLQLPDNVKKSLMLPFFELFNLLLKSNKKDLQKGYAVVKSDCGQACKKTALLALSVICTYYGLRNLSEGNSMRGSFMGALGLIGILYGGPLIDLISKK